MAGVRRSVVLAVVTLVGVWLDASLARADHCHRSPLEPGSAPAQTKRKALKRVEVRSSFATFATERYRGSYEGLNLTAGWSDRRFRMEAGIPIYRLSRNGKIERGLGDALLAAAVKTWSGPAWRAGFETASTLPTGDAEAELGMGHVMLLPSAWGSFELWATRFSVRLGYAAAFGETAGHHTSGMSPLVAPMNAREVLGALSITQRVLPQWGIRAGVDLAVPTGPGLSRSIVFASVLFEAGAFDSSLELELPLLGDPFEARASTSLAVSW